MCKFEKGGKCTINECVYADLFAEVKMKELCPSVRKEFLEKLLNLYGVAFTGDLAEKLIEVFE